MAVAEIAETAKVKTHSVKAEFKWRKELVITENGEVPVCLFTYFEVLPQGQGNGRAALKMIEQIAEQNNCQYVIGEAPDSIVEFYKKCGWRVSKAQHNDMWIVMSEFLKEPSNGI